VAYEVALGINILLTDRERIWKIVWGDFYRLDPEVVHRSSAHILSIQWNSVPCPCPTAREA